MRYKSEEIEKYVNTLKSNKTIIEELNIIYNPRYASFTLEGVGPENIEKPDDYYDNLYEHIDFIFMSMLEKAAIKLDTKLDVICKVDSKGDILLDDIELYVYYFPNNAVSMHSYFYSKIEQMSVFHKQMKHVSFRAHKRELSKVTFYLSINCRDFTKMLVENKTNETVIKQWLAEFDSAAIECEKDVIYHATIPVVNSRIATELLTRRIPFRTSPIRNMGAYR